MDNDAHQKRSHDDMLSVSGAEALCGDSGDEMAEDEEESALELSSPETRPPKKHSRNRIKIPSYELTDDQRGAKNRLESTQKALQVCSDAVDAAKRSLEEAERKVAESKDRLKRVTEDVADVLSEEPCYWNLKYRELQDFHEKNGHCQVARDVTGKICRENEDIRKLGVWVGVQRREYRQDPENMRPDRILLLNRLGFDWDPVETSWNLRFEQMKEYKNEHGHTNVPCKYPQNQELSNWNRSQQIAYRNMKDAERSPSGSTTTGNLKSSKHTRQLTKERYERLLSIGFSWDIYQTEFEAGFEKLASFHKMNGHAHVFKNSKENVTLAVWVTSVRKAYKNYNPDTGRSKQKCCLTPERVERLEKLGFHWDEREIIWDQWYQKLVHYKQRFGTFSGIAKYDSKLSVWVTSQRQQYVKLQQTGKSIIQGGRLQLLTQIGLVDTWK